MRDHTRLKVFQLADELAVRAYDATRRFPKEERYRLADQIRRAAVSIATNIVEGATRPSEREFARFLDIALGSAKELQYEISLAERFGYLTPDDAFILNDRALQTVRALAGLVSRIRRDEAARKSG
jgi:four helix bundle protein